MQILAIVVSLAITAVGVALFGKTIGHMVSVIKLGQPAGRTDNPGQRSATLAKETLGHTRMLQWSHIGVLHWFVAFGFIGLFLTLVTAFGQLFDAHCVLPVIGHWFVFEWVSEFLTWTGLVSIIGLMAIRLRNLPRGEKGRYSRFFGSTRLAGVLRRVHDPRRTDLHPAAARPGVRARRRHEVPLPDHVLHRRAARSAGCPSRPWRTPSTWSR